MNEPEGGTETSQLSKRAARRLIQRAFVLAGRDKAVRQAIREARLSTAWSIEDWSFVFTLLLDRGRLDFERRPAKKNDASFTWATATGFFSDVETGRLTAAAHEGPREWRHAFELLFRVFAGALRKLLENPVDENGDPLV